MLNELKTLNIAISTACNEGGTLSGSKFYENALQEFKEFPAVGTKLKNIETLPTNSGTIIPISSDIILFVADLIDNHDSLVELYDKTLEKLNIIFGIANARGQNNVELIDTVFRGSKKGVVLSISVNI